MHTIDWFRINNTHLVQRLLLTSHLLRPFEHVTCLRRLKRFFCLICFTCLTAGTSHDSFSYLWASVVLNAGMGHLLSHQDRPFITCSTLLVRTGHEILHLGFRNSMLWMPGWNLAQCLYILSQSTLGKACRLYMKQSSIIPWRHLWCTKDFISRRLA